MSLLHELANFFSGHHDQARPVPRVAQPIQNIRRSVPIAAQQHPQVARQIPLMPMGQPEDSAFVGGGQGFSPLNADVAHFPVRQFQSDVNDFAQPYGYVGLQGSGRQVQPSYDNPQDIYRSLGY